MKKAQIETIGLLVIIILLIVLATFFVSLYLNKGDSSLPEARTSSKQSNFLNSINKINIDNKKVSDLVYDCYSTDNCNLLQQKLTEITNEFFRTTFSYTFKADNKEFYSFNTCKLGLTANYKFIKNQINFEIILKTC